MSTEKGIATSHHICVWYVYYVCMCVCAHVYVLSVYTKMAKLARRQLILEAAVTLMVPLGPQWGQWHIFSD